MSSHSINAFPRNPFSRSKFTGKSLISQNMANQKLMYQKLANQKTVRFAGGCCGGNADNALPPLREFPSKQDAFQQQQAQQSPPAIHALTAHHPAPRKNTSSRSAQTKNASTQTSPFPSEPAPLSPENTPDVKPAEPELSVWQKAANWFKQWIEILFSDLEALFSGKKAESSQPSCASATPKQKRPR